MTTTISALLVAGSFFRHVALGPLAQVSFRYLVWGVGFPLGWREELSALMEKLSIYSRILIE
jgi:hypothetical protein